jgi:hypothetical protein
MATNDNGKDSKLGTMLLESTHLAKIQRERNMTPDQVGAICAWLGGMPLEIQQAVIKAGSRWAT